MDELLKWLKDGGAFRESMTMYDRRNMFKRAAECIEAADNLRKVMDDLYLPSAPDERAIEDANIAYDAARHSKEGGK